MKYNITYAFANYDHLSSYFHGPNPYKMPLDRIESTDIDDGIDLELAKFYYEKYVSK